MRRPQHTRSRFDAFAAAHGDGLVKLAYAVCGDRGRAEDAAQEALARVYPRFSRLDDPIAYARRVAINATRDDWRRARRADRAEREAAALPARAPDDPAERLVRRSALLAALDGLPHGQRAVIVLRYLCQLSEAETAATLEISTGTVKSQSARALARLRVALRDDPAAEDMETA